jgi:hypothetical protein
LGGKKISSRTFAAADATCESNNHRAHISVFFSFSMLGESNCIAANALVREILL